MALTPYMQSAVGSRQSAVIPLFRPMMDVPAALAELGEVLESGWLGEGKKVAEFEQRMGEVVGAGRHFVATNSCTAALHLAVKTLDLPPGSKVLTTPITFVSTNAALLYERLEPVFADVEPRTGVIACESIAEALEEHPDIRAIIVVHLGGYAADLEPIDWIARQRDIPVIEDCAHALGARYQGRRIGISGNVCCWSFHAVKNLPIGDGGGISTSDAALAARLRRLRWMGITESTAARTTADGYRPGYDIPGLGYKYHMTDLDAAIGLAMLPHLEAHNERRREIAARYLAEIKTAQPPLWRRDRLSSCHFLPLFFGDPLAVVARLRQAGIQTGMHYRPNYEYAPFANCIRINGTPGAEWYARHELTLPMHPALSDADVDRIVAAVNAE